MSQDTDQPQEEKIVPQIQYVGVNKKVMGGFQSGVLSTLVVAGTPDYRMGPMTFINFKEQDDQQRAYISSVHHKEVAALTHAEAKAAGYRSVKHLLSTLCELPRTAGGFRGETVRRTSPITVAQIRCG
jgi:hypothetical protein